MLKRLTRVIFYYEPTGGPKTKTKILTSLLLLSFAILLVTPALASASTDDWTVKITDLSGSTGTVSYNTLLEMPKTVVFAELDCYGRMVATGTWGGVRISDLLNQLGITTDGRSINFLAQDGYTANIAMDTAMRPDVIIAYELNGDALVSDTLRLVIPEANGNVWISMIIAMNITTVEHVVETPIQSSFGQRHELAPINSTQPTPEPTPQTTPTAPQNQTSINPPAPIATQNPSDQGAAGQGFDFSVSQAYVVVAAVALAAAMVGVMVLRRTKRANVSP